MTPRRLALALAAGLALADASVVTLALPQLLRDLSTSVEGVAAVIGVFTVVLALALLPAERLSRELGPRAVGAAGFALLAVASVGCGLAGSLPALLVGRGAQALGGAAGLAAVFALLVPASGTVAGTTVAGGTAPGDLGTGVPSARRLWLGVAVLSTAIGPALGGALTQAFSWQAIFFAQAPVAALAAVACLGAHEPVPAGARDPRQRSWAAGAALALVSAALTAVLFLLVLLLVAGWGVSPLRAALTVTVLPIAALAGARVGGPARARAAAGCGLVGAGTIALAFLPDAHLGWTVAPQALAGVGMGLALPALGGELLPERDARDAAWLLTLRHAGIALALVILAPVTAQRLDDATQRARERGVALVLDARLPPQDKLALAPSLLAGVDAEQPREGLRKALAREAGRYDGTPQAPVFDALTTRADETLVAAVGESFLAAFLLAGGLAIAGAAALTLGAAIPADRRRAPTEFATPEPDGHSASRAAGPARAAGSARVLVIAASAAAVLVVGGTALARGRFAPAPVVLRDPCDKRPLPASGGVAGFLQDQALVLLDRGACRFGSTREEYVLALTDPKDAKRFERAHGADPRSDAGVLGALLG